MQVQNPHHSLNTRRGGNVAKEARLKLEVETGKPVVTPLNAKDVLELGSRDEESSTDELE